MGSCARDSQKALRPGLGLRLNTAFKARLGGRACRSRAVDLSISCLGLGLSSCSICFSALQNFRGWALCWASSSAGPTSTCAVVSRCAAVRQGFLISLSEEAAAVRGAACGSRQPGCHPRHEAMKLACSSSSTTHAALLTRIPFFHSGLGTRASASCLDLTISFFPTWALICGLIPSPCCMHHKAPTPEHPAPSNPRRKVLCVA